MMTNGIVGTAVAAMMVVAVLTGGIGAAQSIFDICAGTENYVYPYPSSCRGGEAVYGEEFHLEFYMGQVKLGRLEPDQWSEDNAAYFVRLTGSQPGAKYVITKAAGGSTDSHNITLSTPLFITNSETNRRLAWSTRLSVADARLIEVDADAPATVFYLSRPTTTTWVPSLICHMSASARCEAYTLLSVVRSPPRRSPSGLLPVPSSGATYIRAAPEGSDGVLTLLLLRVRTTASRDSVIA